MDVIHAHQTGFTNVIGLSGTALTPEHIALLKRYSDNLMLCLDSDRAGIAATHKHALAALKADMRVKAIRLPQGKDPADVLSEDPKEFTKCVSEAQPVVDFFLSVLSEGEKDSHKRILSAERIVLPLIAIMPSPLEREHFVQRAAAALSSTADAIRAGVERIMMRDAVSPATASVRSGKVEETVVPQIPDEVRLCAIVATYPNTALAKRIQNEYSRIIGRSLGEEESPEHVLFETGILYGEAPAESAADDILRRFEQGALRQMYAAALEALRDAELSAYVEGIRAAETQCASIMKRLGALN